jgi:hypothetical protein
MSGAGHAYTRGEIEVSAVVLVVQQYALATGGHHTGRLLEDF